MSNIATRLARAEAKMPPPEEAVRVFRAIVDPRKPDSAGGAAALEAKARAEGWTGRAFLIDRVIVYPDEEAAL
jgi:hypothetical protein